MTVRRTEIIALFCAVALAACGPSEVESTVTTAGQLLGSSTTAATPETTSTVAPSMSSSPGWLIGGPGGITDAEGNSFLATSTPVEGLARDKDGGVAFLLEDGLYWLESTEDEPVFVADVHGDLVEVVHIGGVPHARLGLCDSTDVDLTTGSLQTPTTAGMVEASCGDNPLINWNAENGLRVTVIPSLTSTIQDSEGTSVVEPARLEVSRAGESLIDVPVGGFYQDDVRVHDFDGRWLLLSRRPSDTDDSLATFFVVDLATGTSTSFTTEGAAATLVGPDADWTAAALTPTGAPFDAVPLLSDDRVTELDDGRYISLIDHVFTEGYRGGPEIHFDLGVWFAGPEAGHFAEIDGKEPGGDYYIRNQDPTVLVREVSPNVEISSVWIDNDGTEGFEPVDISFAELVDALDGDSTGSELNMRNGPWWITIEEGVVVAIDEQYVP